MAWFKKKDKFIDLGETHRKRKEMMQDLDTSRSNSTTSDTENSSVPFNLFGSQSTNTQSGSSSADSDFLDLSSANSSSSSSMGTGAEDRRKKLAKRIMDMTSKLEDLSNQIYHLQQRVEVLERKNDVNRY